jgi:hypothetical protein
VDAYGKLGVTDLDAVIKALFASSEQGAWYDPSDLSTMFQDSSGTAPVTADGQPVGLILDKSKGNTIPYPPTGFGSVPFGVTVSSDGTTDFDPTAYRLTEGDSGVTTYYVDKSTGLDTNPGTSSSPFKTILKAISTGRGDAPSVLIKAKGGTYFLTENMNNKRPEATNLSIVSWDGQTVVMSHENPNISSWTLDSDNTYYSSVAGYGYSDYRSHVWDGKTPDAFGDYKPLIPVASIAACKATANTYYTDQPTARVYVHCSDDRTPDNDIHVFEGWGNPGQYSDYPGSPASGRCYFENIKFIGGNVSFYLGQTHETNTTSAIFNGCEFKYGGVQLSGNVYHIGNLDIAHVDCLSTTSHTDGFTYSPYGANPSPRILEINCESRTAGCILAGTANQGSTAHESSIIVRVNGYYHHNENDQVADVGTSKSWMVNCRAENGLKSNYSGFLSGNGSGATTSWLYGCSTSGCTYSLTIGSGATLHDLNYATRTSINNSGTVTNYAAVGTLGNHATQATAASRPLYKVTGLSKWNDFDAVDDVLNTTFQSSLGSSCTVARAVVGGSPVILTGQTIGTSYASSTDNAGLITVNRALTGQETTDVTAWLTAKGATA